MILVMAVIFYFSTMEGDDSAKTSGFFLNIVRQFAQEVSHHGLSLSAIASLHLIIRKIAHFTEYLCLGLSIMFAFYDYFKGKKLSLLPIQAIATLYATTDEIHQYFVPGRYGTWSDVLIDSCGAFTGILIYFFIHKKRKERDEHEAL